MTCKECYHFDICGEKTCNYMTKETEKNNLDFPCTNFKDRSKIIELSCEPLPCQKDDNSMNTDVYCPCCGTNLSEKILHRF